MVLVIILSILIMLVGAILNMAVIISNGNKMPVYSLFSGEISDTHFAFQDKSEINNFWFTDILTFFIFKFSVGDFLILSGAGVSLFLGTKLVIFTWKRR